MNYKISRDYHATCIHFRVFKIYLRLYRTGVEVRTLLLSLASQGGISLKNMFLGVLISAVSTLGFVSYTAIVNQYPGSIDFAWSFDGGSLRIDGSPRAYS
jgi:hypothetical protein